MHLPPPPESHYLSGVLMRPASGFLLSPRRNLHLSHRERSASVTRRVRAFFAPAPGNPHPASAARLLTSPSGRGKEAGFSLIELAIVLVILGLLAGGVLVGQSLIRAAELRSVVDDFEKYRLAVIIFEDRYRYLPGDMPNATAFWGTDPDGCPQNGARRPKTATCNGNGNGLVDTYNESLRFWQQLAAAGLIEGLYTGVGSSASNNNLLIGENSPKSTMSNIGWSARYSNTLSQMMASMMGYFFRTYNVHVLDLGGVISSSEYAQVASFLPEDTYNIDVKYDDGKPATGKVVAVGWDDCSDAADNTVLTASYDLSSTTKGCSLMFLDMF